LVAHLNTAAIGGLSKLLWVICLKVDFEVENKMIGIFLEAGRAPIAQFTILFRRIIFPFFMIKSLIKGSSDPMQENE
jgi:hypothetical protein